MTGPLRNPGEVSGPTARKGLARESFHAHADGTGLLGKPDGPAPLRMPDRLDASCRE